MGHVAFTYAYILITIEMIDGKEKWLVSNTNNQNLRLHHKQWLGWQYPQKTTKTKMGHQSRWYLKINICTMESTCFYLQLLTLEQLRWQIKWRDNKQQTIENVEKQHVVRHVSTLKWGRLPNSRKRYSTKKVKVNKNSPSCIKVSSSPYYK